LQVEALVGGGPENYRNSRDIVYRLKDNGIDLRANDGMVT